MVRYSSFSTRLENGHGTSMEALPRKTRNLVRKSLRQGFEMTVDRNDLSGFDDLLEEWCRPKEAAVYLKSSESTLAKKRLKGNGPTYTKFGRKVLYAKRDLDEFLKSRRRLSTSDSGPEGS